MNLLNLLNNEVSLEELLNYHNACITKIELPRYINGFVFQYKNIFNIFINDSMNLSMQRKTILHELAHIELSQLNHYNNDLFAFRIDRFEDEADKYVNFVLKGRMTTEENLQTVCWKCNRTKGSKINNK